MVYVLLVGVLAFFALVVRAIAKSAGRYKRMTEAQFEAEAKRASRMTNEMKELQTMYAPSHQVEHIQEQQERLEADGAESGGDPHAGTES
jgi:hypothetical protein